MHSPREPQHARKLSPHRKGNPQSNPVWELDSVNRLLAAARVAEDDIDGIPARSWWPAVVLLLLDTSISPRDLLRLPRSAFDRESSTLSFGLLNYALHPRAAAALNSLLARSDPESPSATMLVITEADEVGRERLIPWTGSRRSLNDRFARLATKAELPNDCHRLDELKHVGRRCVNIVGQLDLTFEFVPMARKDRETHRVPFPELVNITLPNNLYDFFETEFCSRKLLGTSRDVRLKHQLSLVIFSRFLACDPTFANLRSDTLAEFVAWLVLAGCSSGVVDRHRTTLTNIWNLATSLRRVRQAAPTMAPLRQRSAKTRRVAKPVVKVEPVFHPDSLYTFYDQDFGPQRLAHWSLRSVRGHRTALTALFTMLEREPLFSDLTEATFQSFSAWLSAEEFAITTARTYRTTLLALWLHAFELGKAGVPFKEESGVPARGTHQAPYPELVGISLPNNLFQYFDNSYAPLRLPDSSRLIVLDYRSTIFKLSLFLACDPTFTNLEDETVERFLAWLKRMGSMKNPTINKHRRNLLAIWNFAWRKGKVASLPRDIGKLGEMKRIPEAWSTVQVGRILSAARALTEWIQIVPECIWWPALLLTAYDTGLRIDALMKSRTIHFDPNTRWLLIPAETQKQNEDQVFRLHPDTVEAILQLDARFSTPREFLFPWHLDGAQRDNSDAQNYHRLRARYRKILTAAGLPTGSRDLFHKLRRTSATMICNEFDAETARQHLGHSHVNVTKRYLDPRLIDPKGKTAADAIARPTWSPPAIRLMKKETA